MITIYKTVENTLTAQPRVDEGCWLHVVNPSVDEIESIYSLGIPRDFITYPLDINERSRTEKENGSTFILLRIPRHEGEHADIPYTTMPLGIIVAHNFLVTISKCENSLIQGVIAGNGKTLNTLKRNRFILGLLLATSKQFLTALEEIKRKVDGIEDRLQESIRNKEVLELLKYQKSLEYLSTALKTNELMFERLQRTRFFTTYPEDDDLLEDAITENQQAIEMTNISINLLSQMMDAFASIISNNQNSVIKVLTSVTIILSLPTLVASFFGMNITLPFAEHPDAFLRLLWVSAAIMLAVGLFFKKQDWF